MSESIHISTGPNTFSGLRSLKSVPKTDPAKAGQSAGSQQANTEATRKVETTAEIAGNLARKLKSGDLFAMQTRFFRDEPTGDMKVEVIDNRTGDVIMKIPFRDAIDIISNLDFEKGMGLNVTA